MRFYCILFVRSHEAKPPKKALVPRRLRRFKITDHDSPAELRSAERWLKAVGRPLIFPFRYYWVLSSQGRVVGDNVLEHVEWLFSNFSPEFNLTELSASGAEYGLSFYWGGGVGTGYGPDVVPALAELLAKHRITLHFGIYS